MGTGVTKYPQSFRARIIVSSTSRGDKVTVVGKYDYLYGSVEVGIPDDQERNGAVWPKIATELGLPETTRFWTLIPGDYEVDEDGPPPTRRSGGGVGCVCKKCNARNEYAEPNQEDGSYICWECRR